MKKLLLFACVVLLCACGGGSNNKTQPQEESKTISSSSVVLKGKHANLFQLTPDACKVNLVQTDDGWQVRLKFTLTQKKTFNQLSDKSKYERELTSLYGTLISSSDVELASLDIDEEDWDMLVAEDETTQQDVSAKTYTYEHFSYESAKAIYDKTVGAIISGIELEEVSKGSSSNSLFDEDTQEAIEDTKELLKAEGEMLNALKDLL